MKDDKVHKSDEKQEKQRSTLSKKVAARCFCAFMIAVVVSTAISLCWLYFATVSGDISVCFQNETMSITWEPAFRMNEYRLFQYNEKTEEYDFCGEYQNGEMITGVVEMEKKMKLRLQAVNDISILGGHISIPGFSRELTVNPQEITNVELQMSINPKNKTALLKWQKDQGCSYEIYLSDSQGQRLHSKTDSDSAVLVLVKDFVLPDRSKPISVAVRAVRQEADYVLYSPMSDSMVIKRTDLLENDLLLCWEQVEERQYALSWQECRGEQYEVQQWSKEKNEWVSKCALDWTQEQTYTTEHLPSNTQVRFRVINYNTVEERDQDVFQAEPSEIEFHTGMSPLYCTIWPIAPLKIVAGPQEETILGEVPAGQALCVLGEEGDYFKILYKDCLGYIDSRFCMINLPEYMGDLCLYDITNSISSVFRVHGYLLPEITNNVVKGYENVCLNNGDYIVPYLYPCTAKLHQAAQSAAADGYSLRIYDAFRPNESTRYLYDTVEALLNEEVIEDSEYEEMSGEYEMTGESEAFSEAIGQPENNEAPEAAQTNPFGLDEGGIEAAPTEEMQDTYYHVMTDNRFRLGSFLAASVSTHNRGIALDLTLVDTRTQEDLLMQSDMHDLSWYSIIALNNENANLLAKYMKDAGYNDLSSEWWHFQDDETRNAIGLNTYLAKGVSIEGWKKDDIGWKYRLKDGSYYKDRTVSIDGEKCVFDVEGYCIRE